MKGFRKYFNEDEDVKKTLELIPKNHRDLTKGFKFLFEPRNTLHGDKDHVGLITNKPEKIIRISAPWHYGRQFTFLHEVAHLVYEAFVRGTALEKKWDKLAFSVEDRKKDEPAEELFCHAYAATYCKHPPKIHHHDKWVKFIKELP